MHKQSDSRKFAQGDRCHCCQQVRPLQNRYAAYLCELCIEMVTQRYSHMLPVCGWCERKILFPDTHPCTESKSVEWLDLMAKLP